VLRVRRVVDATAAALAESALARDAARSVPADRSATVDPFTCDIAAAAIGRVALGIDARSTALSLASRTGACAALAHAQLAHVATAAAVLLCSQRCTHAGAATASTTAERDFHLGT